MVAFTVTSHSSFYRFEIKKCVLSLFIRKRVCIFDILLIRKTPIILDVINIFIISTDLKYKNTFFPFSSENGFVFLTSFYNKENAYYFGCHKYIYYFFDQEV